MIKQYGKIFVCIYSDAANIIYHRITDPESGRSCYPDIFVRHGFKEAAVRDGALYAEAVAMQKKYGTSRCFFISAVSEEAADGFARVALAACDSCFKTFPSPDEKELERLCADMALSQTMKTSFRQLMRYCALTADAGEFMRTMRERYALPVSSKNEGKKIYEAVRTEILR